MAEYLIMFNDEWVAPHTDEELKAKGDASRAVLAEMREAGVFLYANGGIDASTAVCTVESRDGEPVFADGTFRPGGERLGGFTVIEAKDDDEARYWAGRLAVSLDWPQEVHRFPAGGE